MSSPIITMNKTLYFKVFALLYTFTSNNIYAHPEIFFFQSNIDLRMKTYIGISISDFEVKERINRYVKVRTILWASGPHMNSRMRISRGLPPCVERTTTGIVVVSINSWDHMFYWRVTVQLLKVTKIELYVSYQWFTPAVFRTFPNLLHEK